MTVLHLVQDCIYVILYEKIVHQCIFCSMQEIVNYKLTSAVVCQDIEDEICGKAKKNVFLDIFNVLQSII